MAVGDREWFDRIESFGLESLFKLVLAVLSLLVLAILATYLPGIERLEGLMPVTVTVIVRTVVTVGIIVLLVRIARQARPAIRHLEAWDEERRSTAAEIAHWTGILLAIGVAYEGLRPAGDLLFGVAGFETFYHILFALIALVPLAFLSLEIGLVARDMREPDEPEPIQADELRTDEQHIQLLLEKRGGTVYQGELAEATGWSKAKVSRVLSGMEADGTVVRFRVGRQKIACLPGHEPGYVQGENASRRGD